MIVLVDLDGICADIWTPWLAEHNRRFGTRLKVSDITRQGQLEDSEPFTIGADGFFANLKPLPGAKEGIYALRAAGHRVVIVSAPAKNRACCGEKIQWAQRELGIDRKEIILTHAKELVRGDVLIDDSAKNLIKWKEANPSGWAAAIAYPYNEPLYLHTRPRYTRLYNWSDTEQAWRLFVRLVKERDEGI